MKPTHFLLLLITIFSTSCSSEDEPLPDTELDLSGTYNGTVKITRTDSEGTTVSYNVKTVSIGKVNGEYLVLNYNPQFTLNSEGYGKNIYDSRTDCPYDTCIPRDSWHQIVINEIDIEGSMMSVKDISTDYTYEGEERDSMIIEGELEKQ